MKRLITVRADDTVGTYTHFTLPLIRAKAKEWGADFKLLTENKYVDWGDHRFHFRILELYDLFEEYDVILNLDADILITDKCPNPFELMPENTISTIFEDVGSRKNHRRTMIAEIQGKFGSVGWKQGYINTGFFMAYKCHRDIFRPIKGKLWTSWGSDDVHLGWQIASHGFPVYCVNFKWNNMTMFSEPWNGSPDRFDSYIIHYAGSGLFEPKRFRDKVPQMLSDLEVLRERQCAP